MDVGNYLDDGLLGVDISRLLGFAGFFLWGEVGVVVVM